MCPICISTAALAASGGVSAGGLALFLAKVLRPGKRSKPAEPCCAAKPEQPDPTQPF